jgi:ABC-type glycerol-3-phosphate transport system substrate-binding protein
MVLLFVFMVSIFVACGGNGGSETSGGPTGTPTATQKPSEANAKTDPTKMSGEISWLVFETPNYTTDFYKKVIANFNLKYPNIKVKTELFATGDRLAQMNALYASGQLPDVMIDAVSSLATIDGALLDLPSDLTDKFMPQGLIKFNEKVRYLPTTTQIKMGVYYNKDKFDKYNLKEPKNWEEFTNIMKILKDNGETPIVTGGPDKPWLTGSLPSTVVDLQLSETYGDTTGINKAIYDGKLKFTDEAFANPVKEWLQLIQKGYYHPGTLSFTMAQMNDSFMHGDTAMLVNGIWLAPVLDSAKLPFKAGWFPVPTKNSANKYILTYNGSMGISGKTKYPEQARAFLRFFYEDKETYGMYLKADGVSGTLKDNPTYDSGPYTSMIYEKVKSLTAISGNISDSKYIRPKGVSTDVMFQNLFSGAKLDAELQKIQKAYDDGLKMEGRK